MAWCPKKERLGGGGETAVLDLRIFLPNLEQSEAMAGHSLGYLCLVLNLFGI